MSALPGAASTAVRDLLVGPVARGRVIGVHPACVYLLVGAESGIVALETADGLGMPCAVRLGVDSCAGPFVHVRQGDEARVGGGGLRAGPLEVRAARWWAPRTPRPPRATADPGTLPDLADSTDTTARTAGLLAALLADHPAGVAADGSAAHLLGLGPGLTPAGDDLLAGLLVGLHHHRDLRDPLAAEVARLAPGRTTALSAALLRHASQGHALPAVLGVADALAGHGRPEDLGPALARLLAVGSSSGTALAHGLLRAARTVAGRAQPKEAVA